MEAVTTEEARSGRPVESHEEKGRRYARLGRRIGLLSWALSAGLLVALLATGWTSRLRDLAFGVSSRPAVALLVYVLILAALFEILRLPLGFYSGYVLEHRFGLSRMSLGMWAKDRLKGLGLGAALGLAAAEIFYGALRRFPATWWLWVAGAFILFGIAMTQLGPVLLFPLFFKFQPLQDEALVERLKALSERAGARVRAVWEWKLGEKSAKANAALVGWGATRRIILADTLLEKHSPEEIEAVLAHELAHHVHGDIGKGMLLESALTLGSLYAIHLVLLRVSPRLGYRGPADFADLPLVLFVAMLLSLVAMPAANAYSRWRERRADGFALRLTRNRSAFIGAMRKLAEQNLTEPKPHPVIEFLFYSHPPISKRIAFAEHVPP
jgi:STE24 endopeptidase